MKKNITKLLTIGFIIFFVFIRVDFISAASDLESGIKELAQQISKNMTEKGKKKIAIIEFGDLDGNITAFGQFLAEELITQLFMISPGQFEVVERRQLMKVLREQKLTMSGLLDAKAMESVGKILGIDAIVTGSVADLGNEVKVNGRMIGVDTAKVFAVASTKIPKVGTVAELIKKQAAPVQIYTSPSSISSQRPVQQAKPGTKFQEFKDLRVEVESLQVTKDNNVVVFLRYINKTQKELKVNLIGSGFYHQYPTYITDDKGNEYRLGEISGIGRVRNDGGDVHKTPLTIIPGFTATATLKFLGHSRWQVGSLFSLTSEQATLTTDETGNLKRKRDNKLFIRSTFNITIRNITPTK